MAKKKKSTSRKQSHVPAEKDDGTRWIVRDAASKYAIYGHKGVTKNEATRLATGLVSPAYIDQVS
jgi:hypothetical protein